MTVTPGPDQRGSVTSTAVDPTPRPKRDMLDSIAAAARFVRSFVRRTADGDGGLAELSAMVTLRDELDQAIDVVAVHLLDEDASYREVGIALGITSQAVHKRYPGASSRPAGGQPTHLR